MAMGAAPAPPPMDAPPPPPAAMSAPMAQPPGAAPSFSDRTAAAGDEEAKASDVAAKGPPSAPSKPQEAVAKPGRTPPPPAKKPDGPAKVATDKPVGPGADRSAKEEKPQPPVKPMLVYTGNLRLQVTEESEIPATLDKVIDLAESLGGYLSGRKDTSVEVRIPSYRFREGFTAIEKFAPVLSRTVSADDVSEQFHDLEVRLSNLRATQKRLQEFLARAAGIPDVLTVERELERVNQEIDGIEGKLRFLRSRAAFSIVTVAIETKAKVIAEKTPPPPPPRDVVLPIPWLARVGLDNLLDLH